MQAETTLRATLGNLATLVALDLLRRALEDGGDRGIPQRAPTPTEQIGRDLVSRLADDVTRIVRAEIALVQRVPPRHGRRAAAGAMLATVIVLCSAALGALVAAWCCWSPSGFWPGSSALPSGAGCCILGIILLAIQGRGSASACGKRSPTPSRWKEDVWRLNPSASSSAGWRPRRGRPARLPGDARGARAEASPERAARVWSASTIRPSS